MNQLVGADRIRDADYEKIPIADAIRSYKKNNPSGTP
ncbi:MAG: hypothetical protein BMS9Abin08_1797 [Gammaproteobacteria bacterium]|nr:MAG: hypothetical protein BMS9Abin08_1797 [Gammaproteobacteria bacterium]